ncbi:RDD family protein [Dokdonella soli]|uniref:RDD domain-containing protein n=1 Tax=Dokdonella soli TaxID=529810 RepID=A0ABP3TKG6_9GAMM
MENSSYALVLTGSVLPGYAPEAVWPALATYFRMEPAKLTAQLLARAPLAIKQSDDLGKLQTLQAGIAAVGAEAEICAPDGRPALFVLLDNAPRGPVPRVLVEERVQHGLWPNTLSVAEVGSSVWKPYREFDVTIAPAPAPPPPPPVDRPFHAGDVAATIVPSAPAPAPIDNEPAFLPAGAAIHAGFWRRCAAMLVDGILIGMATSIVQAVLGIGMLGAVANQHPAAMVGMILPALLIAFIGQWLYFALFESASVQATPGKLALGVKVVDDCGRRIGFGRASGRYFGKIVSSLIFNIGYLLAGWTERKQALHDMLAGTLVVFREVQPGQALPEVRPPMPWYGWLLNILLVAGMAFAIVAFWTVMHTLAGLAASSTPGGSGF